MKKLFCAVIVILVMCAALQGCGAKNEPADRSHPSGSAESSAADGGITQEMAYEGVYNYCRGAYDWSAAKGDPSIMYVTLGDESETEYKVIFRSYTGAFVYFYVDKATGATRMTEYVPLFNTETEAGTINLYDYLEKHD